MKIYKKPVPIYFGELLIIVSNDFKKDLEKNNIEYKGTIERGWKGLSINRINKGKHRFIMLLNRKPTHSTIAHECLHLAHYILDEVYAKPDFHNDEPLAYLLSYIIDEVYKYLKKNKVKVRI